MRTNSWYFVRIKNQTYKKYSWRDREYSSHANLEIQTLETAGLGIVLACAWLSSSGQAGVAVVLQASNRHTRLDGQHISWRSSVGRCLIIIHSIARTSPPVISIFSYTSRNSYLVSVFRMTERQRWVSQWFQSQAAHSVHTRQSSWPKIFLITASTFINVLLQNLLRMEFFETCILKLISLKLIN